MGLEEPMTKRRMGTLVRDELLTGRLQGWTLEGSLCDHRGGFEMAPWRPGWWMSHAHGEAENKMEREKWHLGALSE